MKHCKHCRWWVKIKKSFGLCVALNSVDASGRDRLWSAITTGPKFGCVHFAPLSSGNGEPLED